MNAACLKCRPRPIDGLNSSPCSRQATGSPILIASSSYHHPHITTAPVATLVPPMSEPAQHVQPVQPEKTDTGQHDVQERVRYVEVSPPSGWQTMARTVREADEDKVKDCKEDIDTLLVFVSRKSGSTL